MPITDPRISLTAASQILRRQDAIIAADSQVAQDRLHRALRNCGANRRHGHLPRRSRARRARRTAADGALTLAGLHQAVMEGALLRSAPR